MEWSNNRALERLKIFGFPRQPGTESTLKARDIITEQLKNDLDNVKVEEFKYSNTMKQLMMVFGIFSSLLIFLKAFFWISLFWLSLIIAVFTLALFILVLTRYVPRIILSTFNNRGNYSGFNIIGEIPANEEEKRVLVIGAHYDSKSNPKLKLKFTPILPLIPLLVNFLVIIFGILLFFIDFALVWWSSIIIWVGSGIEFLTIAIYTFYNKISNESPGINDNGSGVAIVLELASIFKKGLKNITLKCVLFDGEEIGLQGSTAYVTFHLEHLKEKTWMINFDELGGKFPVKVVIKVGLIPEDHGSVIAPYFENAVESNPSLKKFLIEEKIKLNAKSFAAQSDHAPFFASGIPSIYLDTSNKKRHSKYDNWEAFNPESFEVCGLLMEAFIKRLDKELDT